MAQGPLTGVRVVEFAGLGPAPFCGMLLSDLGADVVRIDRKDARAAAAHHVTQRGRRSVALDLKNPDSVSVCLDLFARAEIVFEGFRPGVMERLGLGPDVALKRNPKLVYGRMTGWGQTGPLANAAGHDINYIAITGALHAIGTKERPVPPLNLIGDFGGGALYLAFGLLAALTHARATGKGQVVDAAMVDGAASLMSYFYGFRAEGVHTAERAANRLDGGAPFYDVYKCADGAWIALGSIEPQFYALLREKAGLNDPAFDAQLDRTRWPELKEKLARVIASKTRAEWCTIMEGSDVCFAPVLELGEAPSHPHNVARGVFATVEGVVQPAPAPRFDLTPGAIQSGPPKIGAHTLDVLRDWGFAADRVEDLKSKGVV
ncbi:MAG: CoA transferase [Alphaproteobacteria bacterium]|nr:CoA transferase [Alphaproteobacteria bacterium]